MRTLSKPCDRFLVQPSAELRFIKYVIRDVDANFVLFEFADEEDLLLDQEVMSLQFTPDYFDIKSLGTTKVFKTGPNPLKNLLILEK